VGNAKDRAWGLDGLKNQSEKCEGPGEGVDGVKNRSDKCEGPGRPGGEGGGGDQRLFEKKSFF
jgi:hypothetical protein